MTGTYLSRWKCDRCQVVIEVPGTDQPKHWVQIDRRMPPRHADPLKVADLCERCWDQVKEFLEVPPAAQLGR